MSENYSIGIDVGGSSTKTTIHTLDGALVAFGRGDYAPDEDGHGAVEYDPAAILRGVERSIAEAVKAAGIAPSSVVAITTDAMVSGAVGIGSDGRPTTAYTTTLDTRFNSDLEQMVAGHERSIRRLVGSSSPVVAAKAAWYRRTQPEVFDRTSVFVTAGGLVGAHLAGLEPGQEFIDPTVLWAVGMSDTRRSEWSPELAQALDLPLSLLPRIVPSTTILGGLSGDLASRVGLLEGTPVVAGMGDQMAGFLGSGMLGGNHVADSAGTYAVVGRAVEDFVPDEFGMFDVVPSPTGSGFVEQSVVVIGGGFTRQWFESKLGQPGESAVEIDNLAAAAPVGSDGLVFIPHFGGQSGPSRSWLSGGWLGLNWRHDRGHLARSMMEAMAYEIAIAVAAMGVGSDSDILGYGGGTSSPLANQIKADVTGRTYQSLGDIAPASMAAALLGAFATGHLDDIDRVLVTRSPLQRSFQPNPIHTTRYRELRDDYSRAVEAAAAFRHAVSPPDSKEN